jgi:hypothetical protein
VGKVQSYCLLRQAVYAFAVGFYRLNEVPSDADIREIGEIATRFLIFSFRGELRLDSLCFFVGSNE